MRLSIYNFSKIFVGESPTLYTTVSVRVNSWFKSDFSAGIELFTGIGVGNYQAKIKKFFKKYIDGMSIA